MQNCLTRFSVAVSDLKTSSGWLLHIKTCIKKKYNITSTNLHDTNKKIKMFFY